MKSRVAYDQLAPFEMRPTFVEVDLSAITENIAAIRRHVGKTKVMAVVKANAYGHGLETTAKHLEKLGVDQLGVAYVEEAILLRQSGVRLPILVLGGIVGTQIQHFLDNDLELTASSVAKLKAIDQVAAASKKRARVHLKIDTGMERIGVHHYTAETLLEATLGARHCEVVGIYSHFATGEDPDTGFAKLQIERFSEMLRWYERRSLPVPLRHMANTGAMLQLRESHFDMVRPGLGVYGVYPAEHLREKLPLRPSLKLVSQVVYFKVVKAGASVSYGQSWTAPSDTRVVTIPIGYGDGYSRAFSNTGSILIRGKQYPIIGAVCMDQLMVSLGSDGEAYNGDPVVLIGTQDGKELRIEDLAQSIGTVPHEILTSLNLRLPRRYMPLAT